MSHAFSFTQPAISSRAKRNAKHFGVRLNEARGISQRSARRFYSQVENVSASLEYQYYRYPT